MTDGSLHVYTDFPYKSGAFKYMKFDPSEIDKIKENAIFIFTHKHTDHYSGKNMRRVLREKQGQKFGKWNITELEALGDSIPNFSVKAFKTSHKFSINHYSYLITWHDKKIFLSGDTGDTEVIGSIKEIDWAFIPYWVLRNAHDDGVKIDAKMKGLYHLYPNQKIEGETPEDLFIFDNQGEIIKIKY